MAEAVAPPEDHVPILLPTEILEHPQKTTVHVERRGVATIKSEYLKVLEVPTREQTTDNTPDPVVDDDSSNPPPAKKQKRKHGQNKHRPRPAFIPYSEMLCPYLHDNNGSCPFGTKCRYTHNIAEYLSTKPPDISGTCYLYKTYGKCTYGRACRLGKSHLNAEQENLVNEALYDCNRPPSTCNVLSKSLQESLRKRRVEFTRSELYLKKLKESRVKVATVDSKGNHTCIQSCDSSMQECTGSTQSFTETGSSLGTVTDEDVIKLKPAEKRPIVFKDKLFLAPLTTVGNLPFRRVCKELGADITCGEMAMCTNLLQGQQSEWALLKRHQSEDLFGVQVCGSHADSMTRCAEMINMHTSVDFVDINTGCPIDLVFQKGAGSALMGRHTRFEGIVRGMVEVLDCPLTVKMRTGIYKKNWNAHKLIPKLRDWGVSLVTVHGRSREQRYTKQADWEYIRSCVAASEPMPIFGNGDILSFEDYNDHLQGSGVSGIMIARGALIKPWIFTEIKERRHWDISSSERLDILRRYTNYGLEHWGSDSQGVENTRKFLLEWLSFLYRYIPVGVLERVPQKINQRPPAYVGRDDLETLMASNNCKDWIKISEMLLGPVPENFSFLPKHKANSYS